MRGGALTGRLLILLLGFAVSASPAPAAITEFTIPTGVYPSGPLAFGPDGAIWFTGKKGDASMIGRLTTAGGYTEFGGITNPSHANPGPVGITAGPDGRLWFTEYDANKIGAITTAGVVTEYSTGLTARAGPNRITAGPDGRLWFTESQAGKIGAITTSGTITEYALPDSQSGPSDITTGPDGALWFTEHRGEALGRITTDGTITEDPLYGDFVPLGALTSAAGSLWFIDTYRNRIGQYEIDNRAAYFSGPALDSYGVAGITGGPDGALWFTDSASGFIGRMTTDGFITNTIRLPTPANEPRDIVAGPDGALWFTEFGIPNLIGRITTDVPPPPTVEVKLAVSPPTGPSRFSLSIDSEWRNPDAGDGDTTGKHNVSVTYHRVGWSYAGTTPPRYSSSTTCKNQGGAGETVGSSTSFSTVFPVASESDIVCTIALKRRDAPTDLTVAQNAGLVNASWTLPPGTVTGYLEFSPTPYTDGDGFFTDPETIAYIFDSADEEFDSTPETFPPGTYYVHVSAYDPDDCDYYTGSCPDEFSSPPVSLFVPVPSSTPRGAPAAPPASAAAPADKVTKFSSLLVRRRQRIGKLYVQAAMSERGTISAHGKAKVARSARSYKLGLVTAPAVPGTSVKLRLKLPRKAHRAVRRALKQHQKVSAAITITATDLAGNEKREQRTITLRP